MRRGNAMTSSESESDCPPEILLIEDNRGDVILAMRAFRSAGISGTITVADSGEMAMAILHAEGEWVNKPLPDIIFADLNLPKMSGRDVLAAVRSDARLKHIPVVILTSSFAPQDRAASDKLNVDGYILKPLDSEKIKAVMAFITPPDFQTHDTLPGAVS
jgi:chemotaxis family two-component system response regulator Rcp1